DTLVTVQRPVVGVGQRPEQAMHLRHGIGHDRGVAPRRDQEAMAEEAGRALYDAGGASLLHLPAVHVGAVGEVGDHRRTPQLVVMLSKQALSIITTIPARTAPMRTRTGSGMPV